MAIVKNNHISGTIGPIVHKTWRNKQVLQSQPDKPKQTEATKQSADVFGKSSSLACLIRDNLYGCFVFYDPEMINRFNTPVMDVMNHCFDKETKSFTFERDSFVRLNGFEFNALSLLVNSLFVHPVVNLENNKLTLHIPEIDIQTQLKFPVGATHCIIKVAFCLYGMEEGMDTAINHKTQEISKAQGIVSATEFSITVPEGTLAVIGLGLQYYSKSEGMNTLINNKTFEPAAICAALINPGTFLKENLGEDAEKWQHKDKLKLKIKGQKAKKGTSLKKQTAKIEKEPTALETKLNIARNLKKLGISFTDITTSTGLTIKEIENL